jgi:hypothetical protein
VDYRSDPIVAVIQGEEGDHFIAEFFNRICPEQSPKKARQEVIFGQ